MQSLHSSGSHGLLQTLDESILREMKVESETRLGCSGDLDSVVIVRVGLVFHE